MRYSIIGASVKQVEDAGGSDIKEAKTTGIIFATLTPEQVEKLKSQSPWLILNEVREVKATVMPPMPIAAAPLISTAALLDITGFEKARSMISPPLYGAGFNAAIVDSGIRETHEMIKGKVIYSKNFTSSPMEDIFNHGTGVASLVAAVAPQSGILNMKVLDDVGSGSEESVVLAIDECLSLQETKPDIAPSAINLSLGSPDDGNPNNIVRVACRAAIEKGIWVAAAGGNGGPAQNTIMNPACERYVMAVGSCSYTPFAISTWSSRGPTKEGLVKPDMVCFGENLILASSESDTATVGKSGTSFPTPFCMAIGLLFLEGIYRYGVVKYIGEVPPGIPLTEVIAKVVTIQDTMDKYLPQACVKPQDAPAGKDNDYGYGVPAGTMITQMAGITPAVDISAILSPMMGIFVLGMFGMMMTSMVKSIMR